jgi:hypothetical protein
VSVCPERYADAAIQMRQAYNRDHPSWQALENQARADIAAERGVDPATVHWREITSPVRKQAPVPAPDRQSTHAFWLLSGMIIIDG